MRQQSLQPHIQRFLHRFRISARELLLLLLLLLLALGNFATAPNRLCWLKLSLFCSVTALVVAFLSLAFSFLDGSRRLYPDRSRLKRSRMTL